MTGIVFCKGMLELTEAEKYDFAGVRAVVPGP